jgi:transcriptional regulator with XRE-family HTH domain
MTGTELAEVMGVRKETMSRWENDKSVMNDQAERLLRMLVAEDTSIVEDFPARFGPTDQKERLKADNRDGEWQSAG